MGHVAAQMFLQTPGDVAVLGECRLIESFAFPIEDKSLAELLDFKRPGNRLAVRSQCVTIAGKSSRLPTCALKYASQRLSESSKLKMSDGYFCSAFQRLMRR